MARLRFGRSWSATEIEAQLRALRSAPRNFHAASFDAMTSAQGWSTERATFEIGHEPPGPPLPGGCFERLRRAVAAYAFSDPDIVQAHFDPHEPLLGRTMLLEIKVLGLHYAAGVRVTEVDDTEGQWGFRYDTLRGHIERGAEWFRLTKDRRTGVIRFRIESRWKPGDFPNAWSRAGFGVLAPRYRMLWIRRAAVRLRALTDAASPLDLSPVMRWSTIAGVGALTGLRSTAGPMFVAALGMQTGAAVDGVAAERVWARPATVMSFAFGTLVEIVVDKQPRAHMRGRVAPLLLHVIAAGASAAVVARAWRQATVPSVLLAGACAAGSGVVATALRRVLARRRSLSSAVLGVVEDALVAGIGAGLLKRCLAGRPELSDFLPGPDLERRWAARARRRLQASK